jgi:hypothetical protein
MASASATDVPPNFMTIGPESVLIPFLQSTINNQQSTINNQQSTISNRQISIQQSAFSNSSSVPRQ